MNFINEIKFFFILFITLKLYEKGFSGFFIIALILILIELVNIFFYNYLTEKEAIKRVNEKLKENKNNFPFKTGRSIYDDDDNRYNEFLTLDGKCNGCFFHGEKKHDICFKLCKDENKFIYKKQFFI